ncbi:MAG: glycosyl transferase [Bradyrhizobium sp.]|nr:MAG: glycosyl transferase [Bradyrhizobium sp.]
MTPPNDQTPNPTSPLAALMERAKTRALNVGELIQAAESLAGPDAATSRSELYKTWIAFNEDHPLAHLAYFNYSVSLRALGDIAGAIHALRACRRIAPDFGPAGINLGRALEDSGQTALAVAQWREFAETCADVTPTRIGHRLMTLQNIGRVLEGTEQFAAAEEALRQALELRSDRTEAGQHWAALRQRQCKWPTLEPSEHATNKQMLAAMSPISLAAYCDDPMFQLARACAYNKSFAGRPERGPVGLLASRKRLGAGKRLRIGYVSSDLREHAVGFALSEVFELHDKSKVEAFGYYMGEPRVGDPVQERMKAALDHWRPIAALSDLQAAELIAADEIDIVVDLNGYTKHARTKIFGYRPAPIIVNWCGYPGSMGSPYHHYLIADDYIIPPENEIFYSERVLRIPCNQPLDRKRPIAAERPTRAEAGLPEDAFIYASFNGMQKVTAACFSRWMDILREVPGSVLWLLAGDGETNKRLQEAAAARGVAQERILFAGKAGNPHHLARIALADLLLDTAPYGAHSTAADALTMGLPILTLEGRSFASRFCGSVVSAAGLADLICATPEDYVRRAIGFGRDRASLGPYRDKLRRERDKSVLRDISALTRSLEEAFQRMQSEGERGATPVPDLTNLDLYFEIGAEFNQTPIEFMDARSYRALYVERLTKLNAFAPIAQDARFWRGEDLADPARRSAAA